MRPRFISFDDIDGDLRWSDMLRALSEGHKRPKAQVDDTILKRGGDTLLNRSAWIDGLGIAVKAASVFPKNRDLPSIHGGVMLLDDKTGALRCILDFGLVTKWKTAADSLLASKHLAYRGDHILIVGAGTVARNMCAAYQSIFPKSKIAIWARDPKKARRLGHAVADNLEEAVKGADIICTATLSKTPLIKGAWLRPGQHLDLIGAFRPDMREVDDEALRRARLFVDSRMTTIGHIGEIKDPLARGVIEEADILGDFYDFESGAFSRSAKDITICKNGGGAHLDLMIADAIEAAWKKKRS